ncbi:hypothetical protein ACFE04_018358 [Oxalis oulophora]
MAKRVVDSMAEKTLFPPFAHTYDQEWTPRSYGLRPFFLQVCDSRRHSYGQEWTPKSYGLTPLVLWLKAIFLKVYGSRRPSYCQEWTPRPYDLRLLVLWLKSGVGTYTLWLNASFFSKCMALGPFPMVGRGHLDLMA